MAHMRGKKHEHFTSNFTGKQLSKLINVTVAYARTEFWEFLYSMSNAQLALDRYEN